MTFVNKKALEFAQGFSAKIKVQLFQLREMALKAKVELLA
jgi:hypothetical protein